MQNSFGYDKALQWSEIDDAVFEIDEQPPLHHVEELIIIVVFVPMVFAFDDTDAHHRIIDLAQRLIEPLVFAAVGQRLYVDHLQRLVQEIQACLIRIVSNRISHAVPPESCALDGRTQ